MPTHVLQDPAFWDHFQRQVRSRSWKCPFPPDLLTRDLERDARLYADDTLLRKRRRVVADWTKNDTRWVELVLGACREIADDRSGPHSRQLEDLQMLEALSDFVEHIHCFGIVASVMASRGRVVTPLSQDSSGVHDIDKLDPVMLAGYSERFEDGVSTSVWDACVTRHTLVNPHHQAHPMWHGSFWKHNCSAQVSSVSEKALSEMVCDKVSRRLQKELDGAVRDAMWDVDLAYFDGLPRHWLDRAEEILADMKKQNASAPSP